MHPHAYDAIAQFLQYVPVPRRVLDLGGRDINGTVRPLCPGVTSYTSVDLVAGPGVDVVADGATYVPDVPPDCVVCCEVLEHTAQAAAIVAHAAAILAPGGSLLITCAMAPRAPHSAVDGCALRPDEYYGNLDPDALQRWLTDAGLRVIDLVVRPDRGDLYACAVKEAA